MRMIIIRKIKILSLDKLDNDELWLCYDLL